MTEKPENVFLSGDGSAVVILDQTKLPNRTEWIELRTPEEMYEAIAQLKVRGAPAIGICAAFCLYVLAGQIQAENAAEFLAALRERKDDLNGSRPTAVNLSWALKRMERVAGEYLAGRGFWPGEGSSAGAPGRGAGASFAGPRDGFASVYPGLLLRLKTEAEEIQREDIRMCRSIAENGLTLLKEGDGILTHCNAGPLATSCYGTALGPILLGTARGMRFHVYADETRPLLQGARLTSYELVKAGVDVTLICDNMANTVMKNGWIQACLVGCDRVAANGDTANKIGTGAVAILAAHYGIPFYVLGPTSTVDLSCRSGAEIPVEQRDPSEIREKFYQEPMAPKEVRCYNPAFDVTDHSLITGIVTEQGICRPPYETSLAEAVRKGRTGR